MQILEKDLATGCCPAARVVCVVIDEAHRAVGKSDLVKVTGRTHRPAGSALPARALARAAQPSRARSWDVTHAPLGTPSLGCHAQPIPVTHPPAGRTRRRCPLLQAVQRLRREGAPPRVLALSATPGTDHAGVQEVVRNLGIQAIEYRRETDPDVAPYCHPKLTEMRVCR